MLSWKVVDRHYLDYLRTIEPRIPFSEYGENKHKPFFGELFRKKKIAYITQISHPQSRHKKMKNSIDFQKVYHPVENRLIAVVNLNYMFPIHIDILKDLEYKDIEKYRSFISQTEKSKYIDLLRKELLEINKLNLEKKALRIYELKKDYPESQISKRCFNFKELEGHALKYLEIL